MTLSAFADNQAEQFLTHNNIDKKTDLSSRQKNINEKPSLTLPVEEELDLLNQLSKFELGQFLLKNRGLNGYWTSYIIIHGPKKTNLDPLENWLLNEAPAVKATQDRFQIFRQQLQIYLKGGTKIASIPCGLMDDLLGLNYTDTKNIQIVGIDLDEQSLQLAQENAQQYKIDGVNFIKKDAWNLEITEEYDIITSNGLNIYQPDDEKVIRLYQEFHKALKQRGVLIISFLTPPPILSKESTWRNYDIKATLKQKAIFGDIIQATWQTFRTEAQISDHLKKAGFTIIDVIYDHQGMFPTIVAQKNDTSRDKDL